MFWSRHNALYYAGSAPPPPAPEITVTGNGNAISDGDTTPSAPDHTDFGTITQGSPFSRSFTIGNAGAANLNISSVGLSGAGAPQFTITADPTGVIAPAGTGTLTIRADAATVGTFAATVTINSDDSDEGVFTFDIAVDVDAPPSDPVDLDGGTGTGGLGGDVSIDPPMLEGAPGSPGVRGTGRAAIRPPPRLRPVRGRIVTINGLRYVRPIDDEGK